MKEGRSFWKWLILWARASGMARIREIRIRGAQAEKSVDPFNRQLPVGLPQSVQGIKKESYISVTL